MTPGNWPGKTVETAHGYYEDADGRLELVDLPGCYSLLAHSEEEEVARDYICFEQPACVIAVCDATALERNLNLVLQIMETTPQVVVCVNLLDEAAKKEISVDLAQLASRLGVPVIGTAARSKTGLDDLIATVKQRHIACRQPQKHAYPEAIEAAIAKLEPELVPYVGHKVSPRWLAIRLLERAAGMSQAMERYLGINLYKIPAIAQALTAAQRDLVLAGYPQEELRDAKFHSSRGSHQSRCRDLSQPALRATGSQTRSILHRSVYRICHYVSFAFRRLLADDYRFQLSFRNSRADSFRRSGLVSRPRHRAGRIRGDLRSAFIRRISCHGLGGFRDVAADGDLFPAFHLTRRPRLFAACRV